MSTLGAYLTNKLEAWVKVDGFDGFEVKVAYLSREELNKISTAVTRNEWSPKTRQKENTINQELFVKKFVEATVLDWKGFTLEHATKLLPLDVPEDVGLDTEIDFDKEEAAQLVANSPVFDSWLNDIVFDLARFPRGGEKSKPKRAAKVSK